MTIQTTADLSFSYQNNFKWNLWIACPEFVTSPSYGSYFYILAIIKCHRAQKKNANSPPLLCFLSCFNAVDKKILRQDVTERKKDRMWCNQSFVAIFRIFLPPSFRIIRILNFNVTIMKTCLQNKRSTSLASDFGEHRSCCWYSRSLRSARTPGF